MPDPQKPRILILENDETIRQHVRSVLGKVGWDVHCETVSKQALLKLEESKAAPFNLFISNFKLPKMEGDDILKKAKEISPMTQRMLMVPDTETNVVIRAINKGGINSCLIYPFTDEDLLNQVKNCLVQFRLSMKRRQLKRVTTHQNKQMFQIAQKLKKKNTACQERLDEKKAEKLMQKSRLRKALIHKSQTSNSTLGDRIDQHKIPATPESFQKQFGMLCDYIKAIFDSAAAQNKLDPIAIDVTAAIAPRETKNQEKVDGITSNLIPRLLKTAFASPKDTRLNLSPENTGSMEKTNSLALDTEIKIAVSKDQTEAYIQNPEQDDSQNLMTLSTILDLLRKQDISYGIIEDEAIEAWISVLKKETGDLLVAKGDTPVLGKDGQITYHFKNDFTNPGKIMDDGTIDFRDRGEIPYVRKDDLLAKKMPAQASRNGMDIFGTPIPVEEVLDPVFIGGSGTRISEDGLSIYADLDGQPHLDALGNITVNPELTITGDVDFETGNIDFNGNIVVTGIIKEGFTVKGINLTAKEIEGSIIHLSGDLNISAGITEADITAQGNVYAKFVNHSTIKGFGDLVIQKEIIDSTIIISGACQNTTGHIISSKISAKCGIDAGKIGTPASKPSTLKVGTDEYIESLIRQVDEQLKKSLSRLSELRENIKSIEAKDQALYEQITQKAQIQEQAQNEVKQIQTTLPALKKAGDVAGLQKAGDRIKKLTETADAAEGQLNEIFEAQDRYAKEIDRLKEQIRLIEEKNKTDVLRKKGLREFANGIAAIPRVMVHGKIIQDTTIQGPNASIVIRDDQSKCQIQEIAIHEDGLHFYEMSISDS